MTDFITTAELAKRLPVSEETLREWAKHGKIPGKKIGRIYLFNWQEVCLHLSGNHTNMESPNDTLVERIHNEALAFQRRANRARTA